MVNVMHHNDVIIQLQSEMRNDRGDIEANKSETRGNEKRLKRLNFQSDEPVLWLISKQMLDSGCL